MPRGAAIGLYIILAIALAALIISGITAITKRGSEEEQDIEHLDHEIRSDELGS
jgi:hypothetical protein